MLKFRLFCIQPPNGQGEVISESEAPPRIKNDETTAPHCDDNLVNREPGILILLDETGSMQDLGGIDPKKGWGRGRDIIIEKFNQFIGILQQQVQNGEMPDTQFTLVTFNKVAKVVEYPSILDMQPITEDEYNPGFGTNLYDSVGCALSEYLHVHNGPAAKVFIISDGIHNPGNLPVKWADHEIHHMVSKLRDEQDWEFSFFGAMNPEDKAHLKHEAMNLGIRWSETKKFDFSTNSIDIILKSITSSLKTGSEDFACFDELEEKSNKKCPRGRRGKACRKFKREAAYKISESQFRLCDTDAAADDSDQIMP